MRNRGPAALTMVVTSLLLLTSSFTLASVSEETLASTDYTLHDPIFIIGNDDFTAANGVTGGSGTHADPYIIEGWEIGPPASPDVLLFPPLGIAIYHTNEHFIIRNVYIHSTTDMARGGIYFSNVSNGQIEDSILSSNQLGINIHSSANISLTLSNISDNFHGAHLSSSTNLTISDNELASNTGSGLMVDSSTNATITKNIFTANGLSLDGNSIEHFNSHIISTSNLVNGKPMLYYRNCADLDLIGSSAGQILIANCTGVLVRDTEIAGPYPPGPPYHYGGLAGILMAYVDTTFIENNILSNNYDGLRLHRSTNATIMWNAFLSNQGAGIRASHSQSTTLIGNTLSSNRGVGMRGSGIDLNHAIADIVMSDNIITNNNVGIRLFSSTGVVITDNHITNNKHGIDFLYDYDAIQVTHNSFLDNWEQVGSGGGRPTVIWDNGYPSGGNYWSNYAGEDVCSGPNQNVCPDPDGIGDTPYRFEGTQDNYPLMKIHDATNEPPIAAFTVYPLEGDTATSFAVNASASSDPDGPDLTILVKWDWESDGTWDTSWSSEKSTEQKYTEPGNYTIRLEVRDAEGLTDNITKRVIVSTVSPDGGVPTMHPFFVALILSSPPALVVVFYLLLKRRKRPAS